MIEEIGKLKLDLSLYPGEDLYCDGEIEDELLQIARDYSQVEYPRIIEERKNWPILYHLSKLRENIVEWLPITKDMKVLEVGSGCGAITGALADKAKEVTCIELSRKRSLINAYRHMDCENVTIHVGNFQDIEPTLPDDYDLVCLIGVFEYGQAYIASDNPYEDYLNILKKHVKAGGRIAIAIENRLGLKYFAGCREDHLGTWFSGIEGYPDGGVVRTFSRNALIKIAEKCGFSDAEVSMYYPYPDYKFMTSIYSDKRLPKAGELSANLRNFDRDRLQLFDEKLVFDTLIADGEFPLFSNSYMMILGPEPDIEYVRYSNDRADGFKIKTQLVRKKAVIDDEPEREDMENCVSEDCKAEDGYIKVIEKHPLCNEAIEHIEKMESAYEKLTERYSGSDLKINKCRLVYAQPDNGDDITEHDARENGSDVKESVFNEIYAEFEYIEGKTLEEYLDECLEKGDTDKFHALFNEYMEKISYNEQLPVSDYDLIFSNILISPDGDWNVIDYEWTFGRPQETKESAFRALYCYILENDKRNRLNPDLIFQRLGITEKDAESYRQQEMDFQKYVTGKRMSMDEIREAMAQPVYDLDMLSLSDLTQRRSKTVQIYEDDGNGFSEENSYFVDMSANEEEYLELDVKDGTKALRIDPGSDYCIVYIKEIRLNETLLPLKGKHISVNGFKIGEGVYAFDTADPNITLQLSQFTGMKESILKVYMQISAVPEETVKHMQKRGLF